MVDEIPKANFLPNSLLDDNVDVSTVDDYLTKDAWNKLLKLVSQKKVGTCLFKSVRVRSGMNYYWLRKNKMHVYFKC